MGAAEGIERVLIAIAARCLRVAPHEIDPAVPLTRYGLDSLSALELAEAVAVQTRFELPEEAFYDAPSIQSLALQLLVQAPLPSTGHDERRIERMLSDAVLDPIVDPARLPPGPPGCLLLTGANGFVGVHLLRALLDEGASEVICLVRAGDNDAAAQRLAVANTRYGMPPIDTRVRVIAADIAAPLFGLPPSAYRALAQRAGVVLHCAAEVNWGATYEQLSGVNVEATRTLLGFACAEVVKPMHFVSSVAAGYSTRNPDPLHERAATADPGGLHLGYAQTKWVAERLIEAACARGLPAAIYRPTLISGRSDSGMGNDDDLFSRMLRGCVALGRAPELDWTLDACPVDFVAGAIARAAVREPGVSRVMHLRNPHPARWTEAVLWMNLRGYEVKLEPYAAWVDHVRCDAHDGHPLQALRGFLLHTPPREDGRHLAELYARPHVRELHAADSELALTQLGIECPRLSARLLERYFDRWTAAGHIEPVARSKAGSLATARARRDVPVESILQRYFDEPELRVLETSASEFGSEHSLIGELGAWRAGADYAMQQQCVTLRRANGATARLDLVVKRKLPDAVVLEVAHDMAKLCDPALGRAFAGYREQSELAGSAEREVACYAGAPPAWRAAMPLCFGILDGYAPTLVLERVSRTVLSNAVDGPVQWKAPFIECVLQGVAALHAHGMEHGLARTSMQGMHADGASDEARLWRAELGRYAGRWLGRWLGPAWRETHERACASLPTARRSQAGQLHTLIHGDFNPRNFVLRDTPLGPKLCAFDWELAAWGLPQRDVVEFLAFVLPPDAEPATIRHWLDVHRRAIERRAAVEFDTNTWYAGVRSAVADFGATRLPMYFLAHRYRPQPFLERIARTWWRLACVLGTQA